MIVSIATAVFPVWRSPMMSSRCPRPTGTIESIDLSPVCTGCDTDFRHTTPGDTVGDRHDSALGAHRRAGLEILDLASDQFADFGWIELHLSPRLAAASRVRGLAINVESRALRAELDRHRRELRLDRAVDHGVA